MAMTRPRLYKFPPLRRGGQERWSESAAAEPDSLSFQQQLAEGFQEGMQRGFEQGLEEGRSEGYQEGARLGCEEGMRKGLAEGKSAGLEKFIDAAGPLDAIAENVKQYLAGYEARRREELLQLVEKVSKQVIRCELTLHPTQLLTLVEEALATLPKTPEQLKVALNPEEYRRISEAEPERARRWGLWADAGLQPGECRVVTETSEMDIGCQHRLEQCMDVLKETLLPEEYDA
jgi:flagellar assembly protein FliH